MKIIIDLSKQQTVFPDLYQNVAYGMLPIIDKPITAYLLDRLSQQGYKEVFVLVSEDTQNISQQLGNGGYWSLTIDYINLDIPSGQRQFDELSKTQIEHAELDLFNREQQKDRTSKTGHDSLFDYHRSSLRILLQKDNFQLPSYEKQPNLFLSEGAKCLNKSAYALHIGRFSYVKRCNFRGPAIIGQNCLIEHGNILDNTVIMPNTHVGNNLDLSNCLVTPKFIYHNVTHECIQIQSKDFLSAA